MEAVTPQQAPVKFTPFRGLAWVAMVLFCLNALLDVMLYHGVAVSSTRKAAQPVNWVTTPYTSIQALSSGQGRKHARLSASNWYPKDLAFSKSGWARVLRASDRAGKEFDRKYLKP